VLGDEIPSSLSVLEGTTADGQGDANVIERFVAQFGAATKVLETLRESVSSVVDRVPAVGEPAGEFDGLRAESRRIDGGSGSGASQQSETVEGKVFAVVGDDLPGDDLPGDFDRFACSAERIAELLSVPVLDDDRTAGADPSRNRPPLTSCRVAV